jgi:microcompartment protein CcmK/EutM
MQTARVIGNATATVRHPSLAGWRLVVLQPLNIDNQPEDLPVLAIDQSGAGRGDDVFFTSDAKYVQQLIGRRDSPIRFSVQGIIDMDTNQSPDRPAKKK